MLTTGAWFRGSVENQSVDPSAPSSTTQRIILPERKDPFPVVRPMPLPEKYRQQLIDTHAAADRESRWDGPRTWVRAIGEIALWTLLGMALVFMSFRTLGEDMGRIYWLAGCIVWIGGVTKAVLGAYRRGLEQGLW